MGQKYVMVYRCAATGLSHHNYAMHAKEITVGDELAMELDESNSHDGNAIKLHHDSDRFGSEQIGWLSARTERDQGGKAVIAKMLKANLDLKCVVISHDTHVGQLDQRMYVGVMLALADD